MSALLNRPTYSPVSKFMAHNAPPRLIKKPSYLSFPDMEEFRQEGITTKVTSSNEGYHVEALLPGIRKEDLSVEVNSKRNTLEISAYRESDDLDSERTILRSEISYGRFSKTIQLPTEFDENSVTSSLSNGVLTINLPYKEDSSTNNVKVHIDND